jgi:thiamine-monophosphate kinase
MKVSELGEFGLIELFAEIAAKSSGEALLVDIGDDAASWRTEAAIQLATTDALIQDVHFTLSTITWRELGWKALAVNLSDIAAMGGVPKYALVSLGLPGDTEVEHAAQLYEGMVELARRYDVAIAGGNIVAAPLVVLSLAVIGSAPSDVLTRSAAAPGDQIAVTGHLGTSGAGLAMLKKGLQFDEETTTYLREAHLKPHPRIVEGQILARSGVRATIDLSDGLVSDLAKLCKASRVGAQLRMAKIPIHPLVSAAFEQDCLNLALSGGEDYELLFTGRVEVMDRVKGLVPCPLSVIGEIVNEEPGRVRLLDEHGQEIGVEGGGWEHFTPRNESEPSKPSY